MFQTGLSGAVCVVDDEPTTSGRHCGQIDPTLCQTQRVSFSSAVMIQPDSGPVCLLGTEFQRRVCWEILVAGSEQGIEAGQVGLRLITKGDRQTTVAKEWSISSSCIADGRSVCIHVFTNLNFLSPFLPTVPVLFYSATYGAPMHFSNCVAGGILLR